MAEVDFPVGSWDATTVTPTVQSVPVDKYRMSTAISDPYVTDARLRLASVDSVYRLPTSNPSSGAFYQKVSESSVSTYSPLHKFGLNDATGTVFSPIAVGGIYQMPQVANVTTLRIKAGGNAADTAAGAGARAVTLIGLDGTGAEITEVIATNGILASANTTNSFLRLYRIFVSSSGVYPTDASAGSHAGVITIENSAGLADWAMISVTDIPHAQSQIGCYSVPLGKTAFINDIHFTVDSKKTYDIVFCHRENILQTAAPYVAFHIHKHFIGLTDNFSFTSDVPLGPFPALTDLVWQAKGVLSGTKVAIDFEIVLK